MTDRSPFRHCVFTTLSATALPVLFPASTAAQDDVDSCGPARDLLLVNGEIHLMDGSGATASSVLLKGDRVAAIDPESDSDSCVDTIDLENRVVIPGLIDNHVHYIRIANRPGYDTRTLETTYTIGAALDAIRTRAEQVPGWRTHYDDRWNPQNAVD